MKPYTIQFFVPDHNSKSTQPHKPEAYLLVYALCLSGARRIAAKVAPPDTCITNVHRGDLRHLCYGRQLFLKEG